MLDIVFLIIMLVVMIALAVIQVLMIVKFFQIASDVRELKHHISGEFPMTDIGREVDRLVYLGRIKDAEDILLNEKFSYESKMKTLSIEKKKVAEARIRFINSKIDKINGRA